MGDLSTEPSMEEILSSIKRIIAEEGDSTPARPRRTPRPVAMPAATRDDTDDEVLELSDPMPEQRRPEPAPVAAEPAPAATPAPPAAAAPEPILSTATAEASRGSLAALSRLLVKPEPASDGTLEGLVRDLLRPMLREWLDANLPALVEDMVAREIARITSR